MALFVNLFSQIDCSKQTEPFSVPKGWIKSELSKSATVTSGQSYEVILPLNNNKEYRLYFMASSVFNNRIDIEIIDMSTNQTIYDVDFEEKKYDYRNIHTNDLLESQWNEEKGEMEYPHISLEAENSTNIKIIITVLEVEKDEYSNSDKIEILRGCFSVIILERDI